MTMSVDDRLEVYDPPKYRPGDKVQSTRTVRNDGTMPGVEVGRIVVRRGDLGYVRDIGTYLQEFYVYAVDFVDRGSIVGMRARELTSEKECQ
jgi:nitrogen fixation protein NifZ